MKYRILKRSTNNLSMWDQVDLQFEYTEIHGLSDPCADELVDFCYTLQKKFLCFWINQRNSISLEVIQEYIRDNIKNPKKSPDKPKILEEFEV